MIALIGIGIGASMTTLTVLHVLSGDPLPAKSRYLYYPQLDPRGLSGADRTEPAAQLTWEDGTRLMSLGKGKVDREALMTGGKVKVEANESFGHPVNVAARYTTSDFFSMFDAPFHFGGTWGRDRDEEVARVAVISSSLNRELFHGSNSVGRTVLANGHSLTVVGVLRDWRPSPHFYDLSTGNYARAEDIFVPLSTSRTLRLPHDGSIECWGGSNEIDESKLETANCTWLQLWVELRSPAGVDRYAMFLRQYAEDQRKIGRFVRPVNTRLRSLLEWIDFNNVVPAEVRLQAWLGFGFLAVCVVNTIGLMLAKFMRKARELGIRRSLGASRAHVFQQLLFEAVAIGAVGGGVGLILTWVGIAFFQHGSGEYAAIVHLDTTMLGITFATAVGSTILAGIVPAWRASKVAPALQIKSI